MTSQTCAIVELGAVALSRAIHARSISCAAVMGAYLDRIERLNPAVNAIVALQERADLLRQAAARDAELARGRSRGPLHGFPLAVKDLAAVAGLPFTQGSPIFRDRIAESDAIMVERLRRGGALFIGKTNTPEFGLGSQTFNPVHGTTRNAYDPARTAGGSSGGAAVAVALRMQPVADGSDHAGSLRNPPAFNNLFGLRPCYGRIPQAAPDVFTPGLAVEGAIGRSPADIGLMLSVQAGPDPRNPLAIAADPAAFAAPLARDVAGTRIAWLGDLRGHLPFEPGVLELGQAALKDFAAIGCEVAQACPSFDFEALWQDWLVLRAWFTASSLRPLYADPVKRALLKPEAIWEVERGLALDADRVAAAQAGRSAWYETLRAFMQRFDFLALPSAQVFPFDAALPWPARVGGRDMDTYHRWMQVVIPITMSGLPALNVPAGFSPEGLPTGIQIVGRNHGERACLELGAAYDAATRWVERRRPPLLDAA
ncbi:amidase [Methylobacterium soli]|uniref:Amidase n=1 Tax=Methylobacterium soli TaxID=553447 RepID=A0A6L3T3T1_9HYPH|nr:amidase [Methylobacterium soli]KAB1080647.1 amidase [Methylobacterium soli]GJE40859.1 Acylamidase [Methylobacterium soli]